MSAARVKNFPKLAGSPNHGAAYRGDGQVSVHEDEVSDLQRDPGFRSPRRLPRRRVTAR
jgi:hypothetical protein